jgi:YD repeat-containing protein
MQYTFNKVAKVADVSGQTQYKYNELGLITEEKKVLDKRDTSG